jgi:hypothetical protein
LSFTVVGAHSPLTVGYGPTTPPTRGKDGRITPSPLILTALQIPRLPSSPGLSSWPPCFFCRISIDLLRCICWCGKYQLRRNTERYFSFRLWFPVFPSDSDRCARHSSGFCSKCTARQQRGERRANSVFPPHTEGSANLTVLSGPALCALIDHSLPHVCPVSPVVSRPNPCLSFEFMPGPHSLLARKNKPLQTFFFEKLCIIPAAGSASVLELACRSHVHGLPSSSALRLVVSACSPHFT